MFHYSGNRNIAYFTSRTQNHFDSTFGNFLSDRDSKRDTDQIGILELSLPPLVPVIENHVNPSRFQPLRNVLAAALTTASFTLTGATTTSNGAIEAGSQNPFSSFPCSTAAVRMRSFQSRNCP